LRDGNSSERTFYDSTGQRLRARFVLGCDPVEEFIENLKG
jgi:hypothetical protein